MRLGVGACPTHAQKHARTCFVVKAVVIEINIAFAVGVDGFGVMGINGALHCAQQLQISQGVVASDVGPPNMQGVGLGVIRDHPLGVNGGLVFFLVVILDQINR